MKIQQVLCESEMFQGSGQGSFLLCDSVSDNENLTRYNGMIDLVYIDPPFFTGKKFKYKSKVGEKGYKGDPNYILTIDNDFDNSEGGREQYLEFMKKALLAARDLLKDTGSIYIHIDYRVSAYIRLLADEVFGEQNFLNEIIWHYKSGGRAVNCFSRKHDTLYLYRKGKKTYFNPEAVGEVRGTAKRNNMRKAFDESGKAYFSITTGGKEYRYYEDSILTLSDVWTDIAHLHQKDPERTGYPTQKPEALLNRVILASCPENGCVADIFAGSGTTAAVSAKLRRNWVAADANIHSYICTKKRVIEAGGMFSSRLTGCSETPAHVEIAAFKNLDSITVTLLGYNLSSGQETFQDADYSVRQISFFEGQSYSNNRISTEGYIKGSNLSVVDFWAVGFYKDGCFTASEYSLRSAKNPVIKKTLSAKLAKGVPCINIIDSYGNNTYFALHM